MIAYLKINYTTSEILNHNESQVQPQKPKLIQGFKAQILETTEKYFGEFTRAYESIDKSSDEKNQSYEQRFVNISTILNIHQKSKTPKEFFSFFKNKPEEKNLENITHKLNITLQASPQVLLSEEAKPALEEIAKIVEQYRKIDENANIKYKLREF